MFKTDLVFASDNDKITIFEYNNPMVPDDVFHKPFNHKITLTCQELLRQNKKNLLTLRKQTFHV